MGRLLTDVTLGPILRGIGPLGAPASETHAGFLFNSTLSKIIGVMTVVGFVWFTFMVIIGAIRLLTSGGDKGAVEGARKQITTGIIGVVVVVAAIFIVSLIGTLLGIGSILRPTCILDGSC